MKKTVAHVLAFILSQAGLIAFLPTEYQPVGSAVVALAQTLVALFQEKPQPK